MSEPECWSLEVEGRRHDVEVRSSGLGQAVVWCVDGEEVAAKNAHDEKVVLEHEALGAVSLKLARWTSSARRVRWHAPDSPGGAQAAAQLGLGGVDLVPEAGTRAARRQERLVAHPRRYVVLQTVAALAGVLLPLLFTLLMIRFAAVIPWPSIPWPDWRLPSIPWPDVSLPSIPWPDWDLPDLPGWLREALSYLKYAVPVVVAFVIARGEVKRRQREHAERRAGAGRPDSGRSLQENEAAQRGDRPEAGKRAGIGQKRAGREGSDEGHTAGPRSED